MCVVTPPPPKDSFMKIYIMKQQMRQAKRVNYLDEHLNCLFYNGNPEIGFRHLTLQKGKTWCELSAKNNYFFFCWKVL